MKSPGVTEQLLAQGAEPVGNTPQELDAYIQHGNRPLDQADSQASVRIDSTRLRISYSWSKDKHDWHSVLLYDPTAPRMERPQQAQQPLAGLAGKVVGFIDNAKPNFNLLVDDLAELLIEQLRRQAGDHAPQALGVGAGARRRDQGACRSNAISSSPVRRLRVLHVVECPRQCRSGEARPCRAHGLLDCIRHAGPRAGEGARLPRLPIAVIPHPFGMRTRDEVRAMAREVRRRIARLVSEGSAEMSAHGPAALRQRARAIEVPDDIERSTSLSRAAVERRPAPRAADARARRAHAARTPAARPTKSLRTSRPASARRPSSASRSMR